MTLADERTALPDKRVGEIAAASRQRLRYWEKTDLITPDVERVISPRHVVRLYSLPRVVELVVSELRRQGLSLQHIRRISGAPGQCREPQTLLVLVVLVSGGHGRGTADRLALNAGAAQ